MVPRTCCLLEEMVPLRSGLFAIVHMLNENSILMSCYRYFNEEKTKLEAEWHNINRQVNVMKNQYMELRKKVDSLSVCSLTFIAKRTWLIFGCQF